MDVLVAFIAFAGALTAGFTTAVLIGRLREEATGWLIAWTVTTVVLTLSLGATGLGLLTGFGSGTFRISQITGSLLAPLWLSVGLLQLLADKGSSRIFGWLLGTALTVIGSVIMLLDPVSGAFSKALPKGGDHWDIWPEWLLRGVHGLVILMLLISLAIALLSWRDGDDVDIDNMNAAVVLAPAGMALTVALELGLPGILVVVLMTATAGGIWYAVSRPLAPYEDDEDEEDDEPEEWKDRGRRNPSDQRVASAHREMPVGAGVTQTVPPPPRRSGLGDLVAELQAEEEAERASRMRQQDGFPGHGPRLDDFGGPMTGHLMASDPLAPSLPSDFGMTPPAVPHDMPATGVMFPVTDGPPSFPQETGGVFGAAASRQGVSASAAMPPASVKPAPSTYGILTVFTLMDGSGEAFDKLAEETVEAVLRNEPDTLIFVCHAVKSAPLQRIVYELYRDEVSFSEHQRQSHMERFATERQPLVLATNVIELAVNAAKVTALPQR
ncbi:putative quinol monooxygenase [Planotetraspora thailandica]|nr:antibiotic biosynthesis monooxygenase [Planotetraspora thailandica]